MDVFSRSYTNLMAAISISTLAIVGLMVWNLWLHNDPLFMMTMLAGEQIAPSFPAVPWSITGIIFSFCLAATLLLYRGYRMVHSGSAQEEPAQDTL